MRRLTTILLMLTIPAGLWAQAANIFFSEYVEGSSFNKALEIFNTTDQTIQLDDYVLRSSANEATDWEFVDPFPGGATIAPGDVFVIVDNDADQELKDVADWITSGFEVNFNGNDARGLFYIGDGDTTLIDMIGDPNNPAGDDYSVAGISSAMVNHTLVRKSDVLSGTTDWASAAGTNADNSEWIVLESNDFTNLGFHVWAGGSADLAPMVSNISGTPRVPTADEDLNVTATVTDDSALVAVRLLYVVNGFMQDSLDMSEGADDTFSATIAAATYNDGDRIEYSVAAVDDAGQRTVKSGTPFFAGTSAIALVKPVDGDGEMLYDGYLARVQGTSTVSDSVLDIERLSVYIQDGSGGINVFSFDAQLFNVDISRSYSVVGEVTQFNGRAEIIPEVSEDITDLGAADPVTPLDVPISVLLSDPETFEGLLLRVSNVDSVAGGDAWGAFAEILVSDDNGTSVLSVFIDGDTGMGDEPAPAFPSNITGIFTQNDFSSPYDEFYQLQPRTIDDFEPASSIGDGLVVNPLEFELHAAYPNPFNPSTTIAFDIPAHLNGKNVQLIVYDILGQKVTTLADRPFKTGSHEIIWNGRSDSNIMMSSGIYFVVLKAADLRQMTRLMLIK